jgi:hypothetical protein
MPTMETEPGTTEPSVIAISWLAAVASIPVALMGAACGQGFGAVVGGCHWIGVALPLDRQVWALVNQPVLNFASLPGAGGYWLGSTAFPLLVAATVVHFMPRSRSLIGELISVQLAWAMSAIALAWLPLLDTSDGHVVRFLSLRGQPASLVWLAPFAGACAAILPTLRLLELTRRRRPDVSRRHRLWVVTIHLGPPAALWFGSASVVRGEIPLPPTIALAALFVSTLLFAWLWYPKPYVHPLELPTGKATTALAIAAAVLVSFVWMTGRPLANGQRAGLLWGQAHSFNNIRPWINPISATDVEIGDPAD